MLHKTGLRPYKLQILYNIHPNHMHQRVNSVTFMVRQINADKQHSIILFTDKATFHIKWYSKLL
jgi:hypothetical protein